MVSCSSKSWLCEHASPGWRESSPWTGQLSTEARQGAFNGPAPHISCSALLILVGGNFAFSLKTFPKLLRLHSLPIPDLLGFMEATPSDSVGNTLQKRPKIHASRHQMWVNHRAGLHFKKKLATWVLGLRVHWPQNPANMPIRKWYFKAQVGFSTCYHLSLNTRGNLVMYK